MDVKVRMLRRSDTTEIVSGWNNCLPYDKITTEKFEGTIFGDPNYERSGNLVATLNGRIIGFVAAVARKGIAGLDGAGKPQEKNFGYIKALFSLKEYTAAKRKLLEEALIFMKSKGKQIAKVGEYTGRYFSPGVDAKYKEELSFYQDNGFEEVDIEEDVALNLKTFQPTQYQKRAQEKITKMGIAVRQYQPQFLDRMRQFVNRINYPQWFPKGWEIDFNRRRQTLIALLSTDIVGWAEFHKSSEGWLFGPIAVLEELRRKGIGTCLILESVLRMKRIGAVEATAGWASVPFYLKNGWRVSRRYIVLQKILSG